MRVDRFLEIAGIQELIDDERDCICRGSTQTDKDKGVRVRGRGIHLSPHLPLTTQFFRIPFSRRYNLNVSNMQRNGNSI